MVEVDYCILDGEWRDFSEIGRDGVGKSIEGYGVDGVFYNKLLVVGFVCCLDDNRDDRENGSNLEGF